jgi:hypothetical protein
MFKLNLVDEPTVVPVVTTPVVAPAAQEAPVNQLADITARIEAMQKRQDELARSPVIAPVAPEIAAVDPTDFLLDPTNAVAQVVASTLARERWLNEKASTDAANASAVVLAAVPDAKEVQSSDGFKAFLGANPSANRLYSEGIKSVDANAVTLALTLYKAQPASTVDTSKAAQAEAVQATVAQEASGVPSIAPQTFSRSALEKIRMENPEQYVRMNDAIVAAYATGNITP